MPSKRVIPTAELPKMLAEIETRLAGWIEYYDSDLHGIGHLREVALLAGQIAAEADIDVEAAMVAGFLHDCARVDDGGGNWHALSSAQLARPLLEQYFPRLDAEKICCAIAAHADGTTSTDPLVGALWDADRLTLTRLMRPVSLSLLSTDAGRRLAGERGATVE